MHRQKENDRQPAGDTAMKISAEDLRHRLLPILLSQAFGLFCGIAGVALTSHWVQPAEYGAYGVFVSFAAVGVTVVYVGLIKFINRYWLQAADRGALVRALTRPLLRKTAWLAATVAAITLVTQPAHPWFYGSMLFLSALLLAGAQLGQSALQAAREHWRDLGVSATISVSRSFFPPVIYVLTQAGQAALFLGFMLQAAVGATLGWLTLRRWQRRAATVAPAPTIAPIYEGPWFVAFALVTWLLAGLHRWLAAWFFGAETAGYFTLAGNIGTVLPSILSSIMLIFLQPLWFSRDLSASQERRKLMREVDRMAALYTSAAVVAAVTLHLVMPWLVGRLIGEQYEQATEWVVMTGCAAASVSVGFFYHAMLLAAKQEAAIPRVDLSGAACLVIGAVVAAAAGVNWFKGWLLISPVIPWLVNRTLARRVLITAESTDAQSRP